MSAVRTGSFGWFVPIREARFKGAAQGAPSAASMILISEGMGNMADKNLYPGDALKKSAQAFNGKKSFLNHPSPHEEEQLPERRVQDACGWFSDCMATAVNGKVAIGGTLNFAANGAGTEARGLVQSAIQFQQQFPDSDDVFVGLSINASGPFHEEVIDDVAVNVVEQIVNVFSTDLVTFPARGGKALAFLEAERIASRMQFRRQMRAAIESASWRRALSRELGHAV